MGREQSFVGTEAVSTGALTQRELSRHCTRIYRSVYSRHGSALTARDRAVAAWLWSGKTAVVAGSSAAALLGRCGRRRAHQQPNNGGLPGPDTQIIVHDEWGLIVARVDMGWEKWKVAAELERLGWIIIRVSYDLLRHRPEVVIARVRAALRAAGCPLV